MPGQVCAVKDLTETFDLLPLWIGDLTAVCAGKPAKFVELLLQVKNLFLQIYDVTGTELRDLRSIPGDIELTPQDALPDSQPPLLHHRRSSVGHSLQQPR